VSIVKPITKFAYQIKNANQIKYILEKSFYKAREGRPGPVLIDIPMNFQKKEINLKKIKSFVPPRQNSINKNKLNEHINKIKELLIKSKRPVLILGGGIRASNSVNDLYKFLNNFKLPIVTTWSALDLIDYKNNNYVGCLGVYGSRAANFTVQNADLIINLGSSLDTRVTGGNPSTFARAAKIISVDIDKYELNKKRGLKNYLKINYDLNIFLNFLNRRLKNFKYSANIEWKAKTQIWKNKYSNYKKNYSKQKKFVNPYFFIESLSNELNKKDVIVADTGANLTWLMQVFKIKKGQRLFSAFGNSPMGYALPASIGASLVKNKKKIICITGDGGLQINIQELQTVIANKLPIKIFVFDNKGYGIIKQFQELYLNKRYEASIQKKGVTNPDFEKIAASYNINYNKIINNREVNLVLRKALRSNRAEFIHILIDPNQKIIPRLKFGRSIENLSPQLTRTELLDNMIISRTDTPNKVNVMN
jgi:acetolactate synthase-1/2/3 large subunit